MVAQPHRQVSHVRLLLLVLGVCAVASPVGAQPATTNALRIFVPASAGTPPDIISRLVATELAERHGWRTVVENKLGAMQTIAAAEVLKQPADGSSVLSVSLPGMVAPALLPGVNFRLDSDFTPVVKVSTSYNVLVVHPSVPARSVAELVALVKSQPDKLTFSSGGFGTPAHLAGELFKLRTGVRATHVPYQQFPQAIADLIGGTNQYMFITTLPVLDLIATGKLRALAVTAPQRIPALKDVPTVVEEGFPELVVQDWAGYLVKNGTANDVIVRLNEAINDVLAKPGTRDAFAKLGAEPAGGSPAEFASFVTAQLAYWGKIVKDSGMKMHQ